MVRERVCGLGPALRAGLARGPAGGGARGGEVGRGGTRRWRARDIVKYNFKLTMQNFQMKMGLRGHHGCAQCTWGALSRAALEGLASSRARSTREAYGSRAYL